MVTRSTGSWSLPSTSRVTTSGLPTVSSKPSRRIISTSTASWSSPRPCTSHASGRSVGEHAQRHVADELGVEAALHQAGGELVAVLAGERRRVDADRHRQARVVDVDHGQRTRVVGVGERLADGDVGEPGDGDDLARAGLVGVDAVERLGDVELGDPHVLDGAVGAAPRHRLALAQRAVAHAAQREAADVGRRVEVGDERLERVVVVVLGRGDVLEQQLEQRLEPSAPPTTALTGGRGRRRRATPGPSRALQ